MAIFLRLFALVFIMGGILAFPSFGEEKQASWSSEAPKNLVIPAKNPIFLLRSSDRFASSTVTIAAIGDISFGRAVRDSLVAHPERNPLSDLAPWLEGADIAVANLESSVVSPDRTGAFTLLAPSQTPRLLKNAGIDAVSVANNHVFDGGEQGFRASNASLRAGGVSPVGDATYGADATTVIEKNGIRIAFVAMTAISNGGTHALTLATPETIATRVRLAKENADVVIAMVHAGTEYQKIATPAQEALAHAAIDAGAAAYIGAHPHVVQPMERYKDGVIFYSLGNAVFDQGWNAAAMRSVAIRLTVDRDGVVAVDAVGTTIPGRTYTTRIDATEDAASALYNLLSSSTPSAVTIGDRTVAGRHTDFLRENEAPVTQAAATASP